jgi:hypothetical protein
MLQLSKTEIDTVLEARVDAILAMVRAEVLAACYKHAPMNSAHEGSSVIREEFEELWDHVKADTGYSDEAMDEAIQVAATGVRYVLDLSEPSYLPPPSSTEGTPAPADGEDTAKAAFLAALNRREPVGDASTYFAGVQADVMAGLN